MKRTADLTVYILGAKLSILPRAPSGKYILWMRETKAQMVKEFAQRDTHLENDLLAGT